MTIEAFHDKISEIGKHLTVMVHGFQGTFCIISETVCGKQPIKNCRSEVARFKWKEAIDNEYRSLMKNKTWTLCELSKDRETISCINGCSN